MKKNFILDTCVLIHDPSCIFNFGEHNVFIPLDVIKELDRIKTESSDRGQSARAAQRTLIAHLPETPTGKKALGDRGGKIGSILPPNDKLEKGEVMQILGDLKNPDHRIIATAEWFALENPGEKTFLITKDMGMTMKARLCGVHAEDYKHDKIETDVKTNIEIEISPEELHKFHTEQELEFQMEGISDEKLRFSRDLPINSYGFFNCKKQYPWRYIGFGRFKPVAPGRIQVPNGMKLVSKNVEQAFFLDALLDPNVHLVTASGPAGTGKTLLAMAAALQMVGEGIYTGISISKAIESVGKANGYLPGSIEEKMRPWLQPYADALNFLHRKDEPEKKQSSRKANRERQTNRERPTKTQIPFDMLTESGLVEITAIEHIRGRSIPRRILIIDETQNVPLSIVKTITTRLAEGSKVIYLGDPDQIDNPHLDRYSNGLSHLRSKMKSLPNAAHVELKKGERSLLAEQASKML